MKNKKYYMRERFIIILMSFIMQFISITTVIGHDKRTKRNNRIQHRHKTEFSEEEMKEAKKTKRRYENSFGNKIKQVKNDGPSRIFNCFGLVFCNRSSWVAKQGVLEALYDNGYQPIEHTNKKPRKGDLVAYYKDQQLQHIGIIEKVDSRGQIKKVRSKWGSNGEFIHDLDTVPPEYGAPMPITNR